MTQREKPILGSGLHADLHCGNLRSYHTNLIATRETDPETQLSLSNPYLKTNFDWSRENNCQGNPHFSNFIAYPMVGSLNA